MLLMTILFMSVSFIIISGLTNPTIKQARTVSNLWNSKQSYYLSESSTEDIVYRVKSYSDSSVQPNETFNLGDFSAITTVSGSSGSTEGMTISTVSNQNGYNKYIETKIKKGAGIPFVYALQAGLGGLVFSNNGIINGDVYSNGGIISSNSNAEINGITMVANSPNLFVDQQNINPTSPVNSIIFGDSERTQDLAQSFIVSSSSPLTQINLFIKKVGNPGDITVEIIKDSSGVPSDNSNDILLSSITDSSSITTDYSWVEVSFSTNPSLIVGNTYWIVLNVQSNPSKSYYIIGANLDNSYNSGTAKIGRLGQSWGDTNYDSYFKIFLGGSFGKIIGKNQNNRLSISGGAQAHTITYVNSGDFMRCQIGSIPANNKNCDITYPDPISSNFPISDTNVADWKAISLAGGTLNSLNVSFGTTTISTAKKINGDLNISGTGTVIVSGTLWVIGNITMTGNASLQLATSYGSNSGIIISDGRISIPNENLVKGSGQDGSYIMFVTTSDCPAGPSCNGEYAVNIAGSGDNIIINAQKGTVNLGNSAKASQITAYKTIISGTGVVITYDSALLNPNFSTGSSNSLEITGWRELEQ